MISYEQAKSEYEIIKKLEPKQKYAELKRLCFQTELSKTPTITEIDFLSTLIIKCLKTRGFPGNLKKKLNQLALEKCKITGFDVNSIEILLKKDFQLSLDSATVAIGDRKHLGEIWAWREEEAVQAGQLVFFSPAADGIYNIQVRVVNAPEPILSVKEYDCVGEVAGPYIISVPSGQLAISDFCSEEGAKIVEINPGNYKMTIFVFHFKEDLSYYICLAQTTDPAQNKIYDDAVPVLQT